jgi:hypothetical protein
VQPSGAVQAVPGWAASGVQFEHAFLATQAFPTQHPAEQDVGSHTHAPLVVQSRPVPHAMHAAPAVPQVELLAAWQAPFVSQQPEGHDVASQTHAPVAPQRCPWAQAPHAAPARPHCPSDSLEKETHVEPLQQPPVQDFALQTHWPDELHC